MNFPLLKTLIVKKFGRGILASCLLFSCHLSFAELASNSTHQTVKSPFIKDKTLSNENCISCHSDVKNEWQQSDHSKSMAIADENSVLANFENVSVEHYGQKAHFSHQEGMYSVNISYDNKQTTYPIKFTFGYYPLQQYLVEPTPGKLQVLPFAWDSRAKEEGGQRWYHNYSEEEIRPEDRLHWRQPLQNWNGMCADCHSDGLVRQYNDSTNEFTSQWDNINVGCLSCHGDMQAHEEKKLSAPSLESTDYKRQAVTKPLGQWLRNIGDKTAHWQGKARDNSFMDNCFACHALRAPLTDGIKVNTPFLDQFMPQLLQTPLYHADGQIKEEVYVYGSFQQSKMFASGVNCIDCHDKHTMKVKIEGNGLCLQCHGAEIYNVKSHHQHQDNSQGSECVSCHMPTNRYMGVDDRRDHSFKIPQPRVSKAFNTPNACLSCHEEKNNDWADKHLVSWFGKPHNNSETRNNFMRLQQGEAITLEQHYAITTDSQLDFITRATAIQLLTRYGQPLALSHIKTHFTDPNGLIRMAAATLAPFLTKTEQSNYVVPLLSDELKAVRVEAARSLINAAFQLSSQSFKLAFQELTTFNDVNSWRGEGKANQATIAINTQDWKTAETKYLAAIEIDPYFEQAYSNLAEFYRSSQRPIESEQVLSQAKSKFPKSPSIQYAYGLHLVRQQQHKEAVNYFKLAHKLSPNTDQYLYTYVLALDSTGRSALGLKTLVFASKAFKGNAMIKELGVYLAQKQNDRKAYDLFNNL